MTYEFTPSPLTMLIIMVASHFLWRIEISWCYSTIGGGFGLLLFFAMMFATPFVLWWIIGRAVFFCVTMFIL